MVVVVCLLVEGGVVSVAKSCLTLLLGSPNRWVLLTSTESSPLAISTRREPLSGRLRQPLD